MKEAARKSLIKDIGQAIKILESKSTSLNEQLKDLSDHTIGDVALYKNMDAVSLAVLIYALSKVHRCMVGSNHHDKVLEELRTAQKSLQNRDFGRYNKTMKRIFDLVQQCSGEMKNYVRDVVYASKVKKGAVLVEHGMSVRRAASVMGMSEWDLLSYTGRRNILTEAHEKIHASERVKQAIDMFADKDKETILFFDAGPLITLALSRLLWILPHMKERFDGHFYITNSVYEEVVTRPMTIRRFQFESLEIQKLLREGTLEIYAGIPKTKVKTLCNLSNKTYKVKNKWLDIIQDGEMETVLASMKNNDAPLVMDERTMRLLLEDEESLTELLARRNRKEVHMDAANVKKLQEVIGGVPILRSVELVTAAFLLGILDEYKPKGARAREVLLDSVLWNVKSNGSAITEHEIAEIKEFALNEK